MKLWMLSTFLLLAALPAESSLRVLVFSKTAGYRHESIPHGIEALQALGRERAWTIEPTEDAASFSEANLERFDVVVFFLTTGDVLDSRQEFAFERFLAKGKGYVGVHSASDTEYEWPFYGRLVGAYFENHPEIQQARYRIDDRNHPATKHLPETWVRVDEHYNFRSNPRASGARVLVSIDEKSYSPGEGAMGDHPVAWCQELEGGGRSFYTALGHTTESYDDPAFLQHLAGGIEWAGGGVSSK